MTQTRAFWKAKRMHFWVHTRRSAVSSVHKPKKSDKDSPWVARGLPNTRSPDFYITFPKRDIGPCSFFSRVLMPDIKLGFVGKPLVRRGAYSNDGAKFAINCRPSLIADRPCTVWKRFATLCYGPFCPRSRVLCILRTFYFLVDF